MLLLRSSLRYLSLHWAQCLLALSGIALGVAIVIGMQVTQLSARHAFAASLRSIFGSATHHVVGIGGKFSESHLAHVRRVAPELRPTPVLDGVVRFVAGDRKLSLRLIGIDPITVGNSGNTPGFDVRAFVRRPGAAIINRDTARRLGLAAGDEFEIENALHSAPLQVLAVLENEGGDGRPFIANDVVIVDIATAQESLAENGVLSRIELDLSSARDPEEAVARVTASLPDELMLVETGRNARSARQLTRAFYTNLDALSLLALLVGGFMIYNTVSFLVVQRYRLFARLRALGVTRIGVARLVAIEAVVLGALGGLLGIALGYGLAGGMMSSVARTVRDHYFDAGAASVVFSPLLASGGFALAIAATLAAALVPAWAAARADPVDAARYSFVDRAAGRGMIWAEWIGIAMAFAGALMLAGSERSVVAGFGALGCFILASMLVVPRSVQRLLGFLDKHFGRRLALAERMALRSTSRSMGRIGMAIAALMAATATSIGVGIMVASFRMSVSDWLDHLLRADLYVSQSFEGRASPVIGREIIDALSSRGDISALSKVRRATVASEQGEIRVTAYELPPAARKGFRFLHGDAEQVWKKWRNADLAIISEPFAYRHELEVGDAVRLNTPTGSVEFEVAGVYSDYGSDQGALAVSLARFSRHWRDTRVHGLGVYPAAGTDHRVLKIEIERLLAETTNLSVWSNAELKAQSLAVFDRTFTITDVLTVFATLIAALGVFNAMMALHLEREREYAVMQATGCSAAIMRRGLYTQALIVGVLAALFALPVGWGIALLLIEVINVRSFGWTMALHADYSALLLPALFAIAAAIAASIYPAERVVRIDPAAALRDE